MALKRRQIAIILSVLYLGLLTIIAGYASHSSTAWALAIPNAQTSLTLALPPLAGLIIEFSNALGTALAAKPKHRQADKSTIPPVLLPGTLTLALLLIYETVMATLAGTKIAPLDGIAWALRDRWREMYEERDTKLAKLQTRFKCCGFEGPGDMSVPFGKLVCEAGQDGEVAQRGCLGPWRDEQRLVAGLMLAVALGVFIWMAVVISVPVAQPKVLRKVLQPQAPLIAEGGEGEYRDEEDLPGHDGSMRRAIEALNSESDLARLVESNRSRPSKLNNEAGRWERD